MVSRMGLEPSPLGEAFRILIWLHKTGVLRTIVLSETLVSILRDSNTIASVLSQECWIPGQARNDMNLDLQCHVEILFGERFYDYEQSNEGTWQL